MIIKNYLDYLYEQRSIIQIEIDALEEKQKQPIIKCCENMALLPMTTNELKAKREHISGINKAIEKYLEIH